MAIALIILCILIGIPIGLKVLIFLIRIISVTIKNITSDQRYNYDGSYDVSVSYEYVKTKTNEIESEYLNCPKCDLQSQNLNWFEFRTSYYSWRHSVGRQGFYAKCPDCDIIVKEIITVMN
jgi:hypothetical protein